LTFPSPPILNFCHPECASPRTHHALPSLSSCTGLFPTFTSFSESLLPTATQIPKHITPFLKAALPCFLGFF
jgi:hypothetical protein